MIIGKIMMIQNSSSKESVEYLISKKIMELKGNIKDYTLNRFIEEVGVSKTSMVRYLKNININKFSYFKNVMYEEYMHAEVDMKKMKKVIKNNSMISLFIQKQRLIFSQPLNFIIYQEKFTLNLLK